MTELHKIKLESSRLYLKPLSLEQLVSYKDNDLSFVKELDLVPTSRDLLKEFVVVIESCNIPYVKFNPENILFGTLWVLIHKRDKVIIGDISFKGAPSDRGLVEVGYGITGDYRNKGYMTEALHTFTTWAFQQPEVKIILAETDKSNLASQKTLLKNNFSAFAETELNYWWRLDKETNN
jgi:ribosomal-protein-alanine N-acetyltransferase